MNKKIKALNLSRLIKQIYGQKKIVLHQPILFKKDILNVNNAIKSLELSNRQGKFIDLFESQIKRITKSKYCIALNSGTSALHLLLKSIGCDKDHEILTQSLTFVATCNAIRYCDSDITFIDVSKKTLGMSHESLEQYLKSNTFISNKKCFNKKTKKRISLCIPMHTFGGACEIIKIKKICDKFFIKIVEDSSESFGSFIKSKHCGTIGVGGVFSFNFNKIVTTGSGGAIITNSKKIYKIAKHLASTAKINHRWDYVHDKIGYNYRMANFNAAIGCSQLKNINFIKRKKKKIAKKYSEWAKKNKVEIFKNNLNTKSNGWLICLILKNKIEKDLYLKVLNRQNIQARPIWRPMHKLKMFRKYYNHKLPNTEWAEKRIISLPSYPI